MKSWKTVALIILKLFQGSVIKPFRTLEHSHWEFEENLSKTGAKFKFKVEVETEGYRYLEDRGAPW